MRTGSQTNRRKVLVNKNKKLAARAEKRKKALNLKKTLGVSSLDKPKKPAKAGTPLKGSVQAHTETISGTDYKVYYKEVPIPTDIKDSVLLLWDENARFSPQRNGKRFTQEELFTILKDRKDVQILFRAMKQNKGACLDTPPVCIPFGDNYEVLEGNMRVVAAILNAQEDPQTFKTMPIKIYDGINKADALLLLGAIVQGKSCWGSEKNARLHMEAIRSSGLTATEYGNQMRLNPTRLKVLLAAYLGYHYFVTNYEVDRPKLFTYFTKFYNTVYFRQLCGMQPMSSDGKPKRGRGSEFAWQEAIKSDFFAEFCEWIAEGKLNDCVNIGELPKILSDDDCKKIFLKKGSTFDDAWMRYAAKNPQFESEIYCDLVSLTDLLRNADAEEIESIKDGDPSKVTIWKQFRDALHDYEGRIGCSVKELEPEEVDVEVAV